jgi:hypothetical protein
MERVMFDCIKRLFGEGVVHYTVELQDGGRARGKIPYIGEYDEGEVRQAIRDSLRVDHNRIATKITIVAHQSRES